jgi:hypothetical protein
MSVDGRIAGLLADRNMRNAWCFACAWERASFGVTDEHP